METLSVEDYKRLKLSEVRELEKNVASLRELRLVLNKSWFNRVRAVINGWDNQLKIDDGAYDLFRIFSYELDPILLNERLEKVEAISRQQSRLRSYRKTRGELASVQTNQILGSLFEINIIYWAVQSCSSVEIFPKAGNGGSDVEAKLIIDNRPIFIEAKALTYSKHDIAAPYNGYVGSHPVDSMIRQIYDALNEKLAKGKQLQILSNNFPTVLFLALGFNADEISGPWGIESYYQECQSNISSVFLFGSALCRNLIKAFHNENSSFSLSQKELEVFENTFCRLITNNNGT
ncbi:hypothetical protein ES702_05863 [subsurface metagenome]